MTKNVPTVEGSATVLEAVEKMNRSSSSGLAVLMEGRVAGLITDRRLLREFFTLNKRPEEVKVSQVMAPFYRISPNASLKEAARRILKHNITRLGVYEDEKFLGWVSLAELTKYLSKRSLIDVLRSHEELEEQGG